MWYLIVSVPDHCLSFYFPCLLVISVNICYVTVLGLILFLCLNINTKCLYVNVK